VNNAECSTYFSLDDLHKRFAFFYIIGSLASACAGILAYGLMQMDGLGNKEGWRWIFIVEGLVSIGTNLSHPTMLTNQQLTVVVALIVFVFLPGFPEDAHKDLWFINKRESEWVVQSINKDRGDALAEPYSAVKYWGSALDIKIWGFALIFL
jgi:hypothetical protein